MFTQAELAAVAHVAINHDLFVFTDEIYEYFLFDGREHVSLATLPGMRERTITISGLSKTFSITGWCIGYLAADARWTGAIGYFHDRTYLCSPAPLQFGAAAGLRQLAESDFYSNLRIKYEAKRDQICFALNDDGLTPSIPAGAYYVLADASPIDGANAKDEARTLLRATGVAAVEGSAFFRSGHGESLLRFCFGKKAADLDRACDLLRKL